MQLEQYKSRRMQLEQHISGHTRIEENMDSSAQNMSTSEALKLCPLSACSS